MPRPFRLLGTSFLMATSLLLANQSPWQKSTWQGEAAWQSDSGACRAIVSEARCRLIYLGPVDGSQNLLCAPATTPQPDAKEMSPNWGGHRFWLGPQKRWVWPALSEWEHARCASAFTKDGVLTLQHEQRNPAYPALTREYAWEDGRLRCTVRWKDDGRPYYGLHVVAVDTPFQITTTLLSWDEVPEGLVEARMEGPVTKGTLPNPAITIEGQKAHLQAGIRRVKTGFFPQPLIVARRAGWTLSMLPGDNQGTPLESPDHGYLTQVWVGAYEDFAELEQLTPFLKGDENGSCSSTMYLSASRR